MEVTVLLVVHNCENYIDECIQSILSQSYKDFELLIINDGSIDRTRSKIEQYNDQRIHLINNPQNDYIASLNMGLEQARGEYIARMDGDDLMSPERLKKQVEVMKTQQDIVVCSSWLQCFGLYTNILKNFSGLIKNPLIEMLKSNIIAHSTTMLRSSFLKSHNLLYKDYKYAEDYKLWSEIAICGGKIWVIPDVLLNYRCSTDQITSKRQKLQSETAFLIKNEILNYLVEHYSKADQSISELYEYLSLYNEKNELSANLIFDVFYEIFHQKSLSQ